MLSQRSVADGFGRLGSEANLMATEGIPTRSK
jgi:hypothetical protein